MRDNDQRGWGGLTDRLWLFPSMRATIGVSFHSVQSAVGPGPQGKGKEEKWEAVPKSQVLRQPYKVSYFS